MAFKIVLLAFCLFASALQSQCASLRSQSEEFQPDIRYVRIEADGEKYELSLKQHIRQLIFDNTPVWTVKSSEEGFTYTKVDDEKHSFKGIFYDDEKYMATLFATYDDEEHQIYYNGVVGVGTKTHVVRSAPEDWWGKLPENDEVETQSSENVVEESKTRSSYVPGNNGDGALSQPLSVLHPKILAVVDNQLFEKLGRDVAKTVEYVATFYHAVDLRFSKLEAPKVEILITGIVIVEDDQSDLLEKARGYFGEQFVKDTELTDYDTTFVMTASNTDNVQGETQLGSICNRLYSTAFVQDDASYEGLFTALHELGHLLNLPHDGEDAAEDCKVDSEDKTTVMAPKVLTAQELVWSQCSKNILQEFAKTKAAECLETTYRYE